MKLKVIIIIFQHSSRRENDGNAFQNATIIYFKNKMCLIFLTAFADSAFYLLFFLQAASWLLPALFSVFPLRLSVTSCYQRCTHFSFLSYFHLTWVWHFFWGSTATSTLKLFPPWFLWPTLHSTVPPLCLLWPPLSLSLYGCSVTSPLTLHTSLTNIHDFFYLLHLDAPQIFNPNLF